MQPDTLPRIGGVRMSYRDRIHNFLLDLVEIGEFYAVRYHTETGRMLPVVTQESDRIKATTALTNEISGLWSDDVDMGRVQAKRRGPWTWEVVLQFGQEVTGEFFEAFVADKVPWVPGDEEHKTVKIEIERAEYDHPPKHNPSNGSKITYFFRCTVNR